MDFIYERCGHCSRKGAYVVPDRDIVRCKYCTAFTFGAPDDASTLLEAARSLRLEAPAERRHSIMAAAGGVGGDLGPQGRVLKVESWAAKAPDRHSS